MASFHPFFQICERLVFMFFRVLQVGLFVGLKVIFEMLEKSNFFLKLFGIVLKSVLADIVLTVIILAFHVFEI